MYDTDFQGIIAPPAKWKALDDYSLARSAATSLNISTSVQTKAIKVRYTGIIFNLHEFKESAKPLTDASILAESFQQIGTNLFEQLDGCFCLSLFDQRTQTSYLVRDKMGIHPLYYSIQEGHIYYADRLKYLRETFPLDLSLNHEWIAEYFTNSIFDYDHTLFAHIKRLPPAHFLKYGPDGIEVQSYWSLTKKNWNYKEEDTLSIFDELFHQAIKKRIPSKGNIGAELSGGLDSSTVAAIVLKHCKNQEIPFFTFNHILPKDPFFDELRYTDEKRFVTTWQKYFQHSQHLDIGLSGNTILDSLAEQIHYWGEPPKESYTRNSDILFTQAKRNNISTIFSGHGGDQMLSWRGSGLEHSLIKDQQWMNTWKYFRNKYPNTSLIRSLRQFALHIYRKQQPSAYKEGTSFRSVANSFLKKELINTYQLNEKLYAFIREQQTTINELPKPLLYNPAIIQRIEYGHETSLQYGLNYQYPLLDIPLMEFYYQLPFEWKINHGTGRYIFRQFAAQYLPEEIAWRKDKSGTVGIAILKRRFDQKSYVFKELISLRKDHFLFEFIDRQLLIDKIDHIQENPIQYQGIDRMFKMYQLHLFLQHHHLV